MSQRSFVTISSSLFDRDVRRQSRSRARRCELVFEFFDRPDTVPGRRCAHVYVRYLPTSWIAAVLVTTVG